MKAASALVLIVLVGLLGWAPPVGAEKAVLADAQLDEISAGKWDSIDFSGPGQGAIFHAYGAHLFGGALPVPNVPPVDSTPPVGPVDSVPPVPNVPSVGSARFGSPRGALWLGPMFGVGVFGTSK